MALYFLYGITGIFLFIWLRQGFRWFSFNRSLNRHSTLGGGSGTSQVVQSLNRVNDLVRERKFAKMNFLLMFFLVVPFVLGSLSAGLTDAVRKQANEGHIVGYRFNDTHTMSFIDHNGRELMEIPRSDFKFLRAYYVRYDPPQWMQRLLHMDSFLVVEKIELASDGLTVIPGSLTDETPTQVTLRERSGLFPCFRVPANPVISSAEEQSEGPFGFLDEGGWLQLLPSGPIHVPLEKDKS